jgi:hypothetical protein
MGKNGQREHMEDHGSQEQQPGAEHGDRGNSGEGAASALAHMISQGQQRHPTGDADDGAGGHAQ